MSDYPDAIEGLRFLNQRELPPVSTCWDYQTSVHFSESSATRLIVELPLNLQITFFDPHHDGDEAWICVRHDGARYFAQKLTHGRIGRWRDRSLNEVIALLRDSPLVKAPKGGLTSFTISTIPEHQRSDHLRITADAWRTLPLPKKREPLEFSAQYSDAEAEEMMFGLRPEHMEDKWFIYPAEGWLYFHRSWRGACIFGVRLDGAPTGVPVVDSWVNRDPSQYTGTDTEYDRKLVEFLIDALLLKKPATFPVPAKVASQPPGVFQHHIVGRAYPESKLRQRGTWASLGYWIRKFFGR